MGSPSWLLSFVIVGAASASASAGGPRAIEGSATGGPGGSHVLGTQVAGGAVRGGLPAHLRDEVRAQVKAEAARMKRVLRHDATPRVALIPTGQGVHLTAVELPRVHDTTQIGLDLTPTRARFRVTGIEQGGGLEAVALLPSSGGNTPFRISIAHPDGTFEELPDIARAGDVSRVGLKLVLRSGLTTFAAYPAASGPRPAIGILELEWDALH